MMEGGDAAAPESVVILGAGIMGTGMALAFSQAGSRVALTARREITLERARQRVAKTLDLMAEHRLLDEGAIGEIRGRVSTGPMDELDLRVDLIIESIAEDPSAKMEILGRAEAAARRDTIIATNTSSLSLRELSGALRWPERFAGYHWFNPPELVELVEVIPGPQTREETLRALVAWATAAGKEPVIVSREIEGFVANRLQYALMREGYSLATSGVCTLEDVDRVMRFCLGPRWAGVGPYEAMDLAGLDVHLEVARRLFPLLADDARPPPMLEQLVREDALGTKSGRGLHGDYDETRVQEMVERRTAALTALASVRGVLATGRRSQVASATDCREPPVPRLRKLLAGATIPLRRARWPWR